MHPLKNKIRIHRSCIDSWNCERMSNVLIHLHNCLIENKYKNHKCKETHSTVQCSVHVISHKP